jgi:hypothetical protein
MIGVAKEEHGKGSEDCRFEPEEECGVVKKK